MSFIDLVACVLFCGVVPLGAFMFYFLFMEFPIETIFSLVAFALFMAVIPADIPTATPAIPTKNVWTPEDEARSREDMRILEAEWAKGEKKQRENLCADMDKCLVRLLKKMKLFDHLANRFHSAGITTLAILAGRHAGGSGGIQPARLEREYGLRHGDAVKLKQAAIALVKARPARSPARARRN